MIEKRLLILQWFTRILKWGEKLLKKSKMEKTELEIAESLEQLRVIENGYKIRVKETKWQTVGVDTPEQIADVEIELAKVRN